MRVLLRAFGDLIPLLGMESVLDLPEGSSVRALFRQLSQKTGAERPGYIGSYGVDGDLVILVNGRNIRTLEKAGTVLRDNDTVTLLPPFAGG